MPDTIPEYDELKLRVEPRGSGQYDVVAFAPDGGTATGHFESPISELELDNFILRVARPRSVRTYHSTHMEEAKELGRELFEHLMVDDVGDVYHGARRVADTKGRGLRISLSMTGAPELAEIPWELLYDPGEAFFLSQSIYTPVVRSLDLKSPPEARKVTLPLQVLALVSAPQGFIALDTEAERANLEKALEPLIESGAVKLEWLDTATLAELDRRIASPDELHIIHYVGHGAYDEKGTKSGILVLEREDGQPHEVTGEELGGLMRDERSLRLVVLNSWGGARSSHVDPFSGVASSLLRCGLPAVIGMQTEITDEAAITFSDRLYTALAQGFPIDAALAQARRAIFAAGREVEFGTPVLFMRVADGRIFDVTGAPPPPPVGRLEAKLRPEPAAVRPGATVTWKLEVRNAGESPLSDVTARDSDGQTHAGPFGLEPGGSHECTWPVVVHVPIDETVTVGGRGADGRAVSAQAAAHVGVNEHTERPKWLYAGAAAVAAVIAALVVVALVGGGDDGSGLPDVRVYDAQADDVPDLDVRGDKAAFLAPVGDVDREIRRLNLASGAMTPVVEPAVLRNLDVGLDAAGHAHLAYARCDESNSCDIFTKPMTGPEERMSVSTEECSESRPAMASGMILFARVGEGCESELLLKPRGDAPERRIAGATAGNDLNDGHAVWLTGRTLFAGRVASNGTVTPQGELTAEGGDSFKPPLVVEDRFAYFVHSQGSQTFIARAELPLGDSEIQHYVPGEDVAIAEESPHYAVTAGTLFTTNYPQPNGDPGSGVIVRIRNPTFE